MLSIVLELNPFVARNRVSTSGSPHSSAHPQHSYISSATGDAGLLSLPTNPGIPRSAALRGRAAGTYPNRISSFVILSVIWVSHDSPFCGYDILQRPQLAPRRRAAKGFNINLDSFVLGFFPHCQDIRHLVGPAEWPTCQSNNNLFRAGRAWVAGNAPDDVLRRADDGDCMLVVFGEGEVALGDMTKAFESHLEDKGSLYVGGMSEEVCVGVGVAAD